MRRTILFSSLLSLFFLSSCTKEEAPALPNIILIVADDHGTADLSAIGLLEDVHTPHLDALAATGVRFTQAYASSPICSPARMSILTGAYAQRFGTYWYGGKGIHRSDIPTIPELLKQKGYATGYIGKVHYGANDADTSSRNFPLRHGFDYFFGHTSARKHYLHHADSLEQAFLTEKEKHQRKGQSLRQGAMWRNCDRVDTMAFSTHLFGAEVRHFIDRTEEKPFFLQLSFNAVHNFTHQLPTAYLEEHQLQGYHDWNPAEEDYYEWYQAGRKPNNPEGRAHYLGQLYYLDQEIGRLMRFLENMELMENTLVIYVGDNGGSTPIYANNDPLRGSKYLLYQGGVQVPLIMAFPAMFAGGRVVGNVVSAMDILPTICAVANLPIPDKIDGINILPLLDGSNDRLSHDTLYWDTGHERAILSGDWKWHEVTDDRNAQYEMVEVELGQFLRKLDKDLQETTDFGDQYPTVAAGLVNSLEAWQARMKQDKGGL